MEEKLVSLSKLDRSRPARSEENRKFESLVSLELLDESDRALDEMQSLGSWNWLQA